MPVERPRQVSAGNSVSGLTKSVPLVDHVKKKEKKKRKKKRNMGEREREKERERDTHTHIHGGVTSNHLGAFHGSRKK